MLRRIALTLVPCLAVFAIAACLPSTVATRAASKLIRPTVTTTAPQLAARSGYIVASS